MAQDRVPVLALLSKEKIVEVVAPRMELNGVAEHHEQRKARTCYGHDNAIGVAVEDVRAEVFAEHEIARDTDREIDAEGNAVCHTDDNVQSLPSVLRPQLIKHSEELQK